MNVFVGIIGAILSSAACNGFRSRRDETQFRVRGDPAGCDAQNYVCQASAWCSNEVCDVNSKGYLKPPL